ncbi:hypothetical protein OGM63_02505 [Plectonema radiosum NIES-515]|uniref:Uncharacterized protein n=2 Tax=Plectonema TaxID=1183 RepID=A0ABT3ATG1_9CYAN|nr:hypothetical protein [Plectonema radiosum NIES-515]
MRLIMGCQFSPQDLEAIQQGYELRDALLTRLDADLEDVLKVGGFCKKAHKAYAEICR